MTIALHRCRRLRCLLRRLPTELLALAAVLVWLALMILLAWFSI